jgi:5-methylcytosine-specific restriction endonuclease McrA
MRNSVLTKAKDTMKNRARTGNVPMPSTPQEIHDLLCVYIKRQILNESGIRCHVDHIIPLREGGTHTPNNVRILSEKENLSRNRNPNIQCTPLDLQTTEQHHQYQEALKKLA